MIIAIPIKNVDADTYYSIFFPIVQQNQNRGAQLPYVEYEAEDGITNGTILGPSRIFGEIATESSNRKSVQLSLTDQYVQITALQRSNSIVVRYVIPDALNGGGINSTISLYVNDIYRMSLELTSKYAWSYGGETSASNDPSEGGAHHFFDEVRALVGDIPAGATVKLQKDVGDTAEYYIIDLIDLEQVSEPLSKPSNYISIESCGATSNDGSDDGPAIQTCIDIAKSQNKGVWIPEGTFHSTSTPLYVSEVSIRGAGMWYSTISGYYARYNCIGNNCKYYDFAILGETVTRDDGSPDNGFNGAAGNGSRLENIWVEHTKVGYWVGSGYTDGLVITNSRFRNLFADGVNLCNGTSNSIVEQNHFRNTGDDALASWSPSFDGGVNTNNVFRFNTVQIPWRANCYAIYGGKNNKIEDNLCFDVVTYPGILIAQQFTSWPFDGTTEVQRNSLIRAGGSMWGQEYGALTLLAVDGDMSDFIIKDIYIENPTYSGIRIEGPYNITSSLFENIIITDAGTWGIHVLSSAKGVGDFNYVIVSNSINGGLRVDTGATFNIIRGIGNDGW